MAYLNSIFGKQDEKDVAEVSDKSRTVQESYNNDSLSSGENLTDDYTVKTQEISDYANGRIVSVPTGYYTKEQQGENKKIERNKKAAQERLAKKLGSFTYNPFLKSDGTLVNANMPWQKMLDSESTSALTKDWITAATGMTAAEKTKDMSVNSESLKESESAETEETIYETGGSVTGLSSNQLAKMDIASELPRLSTAQIAKIIQTHFGNSSVISASDAEGIKQAQDKTGMSALAILGIGALESGYGTSQIAKNTGNLWGYGATNINPEGNAHKYGAVSGGATTYATEFMKDYYNGYGAKSIWMAGSGNNPAGKGYAYFDNGSINSGWVNSVSDIMEKFCVTLSNAGLSGTTTAKETSSKGLESSVSGRQYRSKAFQKRYGGSGSNSSSSSQSTKGNSLVSAAKKFLGTPYVWGGTSPSGFDCSGLMQYVCAMNGINISRTTYDQINEGKAVNKSDLQAGDLIFFGTKDNPHHVGMYIGGGQYIQAPKTGDVVKISKLSDRGDYLTARRVI